MAYISVSMDITQLAGEIDGEAFSELLNEYQYRRQDTRVLLDTDILDDAGAKLIERLYTELQTLKKDGWGK